MQLVENLEQSDSTHNEVYDRNNRGSGGHSIYTKNELKSLEDKIDLLLKTDRKKSTLLVIRNNLWILKWLKVSRDDKKLILSMQMTLINCNIEILQHL